MALVIAPGAGLGRPMGRVIVALIALIANSAPALTQDESSRSTMGASGVRAPSDETPSFSSSGSDILRHRSPMGPPCLTVTGFPRSHVVNPNVYDHVIAAKNSCAQRITIRVCYYKSLDCIPLEVPGGERKEAVLGTLPGAKEFRFEFREKF
jgi:hypothetical protein